MPIRAFAGSVDASPEASEVFVFAAAFPAPRVRDLVVGGILARPNNVIVVVASLRARGMVNNQIVISYGRGRSMQDEGVRIGIGLSSIYKGNRR